MACRNCNEMGHFARDCPVERRPIDATCYNCGEVCGKLARDCDKPPSQEALTRRATQRATQVCFNCNTVCGNFAKDCQVMPPQQYGRGRGRGGFSGGRGGQPGAFASGGGYPGQVMSTQVCYNCNTVCGNLARDCQVMPPRDRTQQGAQGRKCYNCGEVCGVLAKDCTKPRKEYTNFGNQNNRQYQPEGRKCFKCNTVCGNLAKNCTVNPADYAPAQ